MLEDHNSDQNYYSRTAEGIEVYRKLVMIVLE